MELKLLKIVNHNKAWCGTETSKIVNHNKAWCGTETSKNSESQ